MNHAHSATTVQRQLRFSLFLQAFAAVLLAAAAVVRSALLGFDGMAFLLLVGVAAVVVVMVFTTSKLRSLKSTA